MKISVSLTEEQKETIEGLEAEVCSVLMKVSDGTLDVADLNELKKVCMEFLQFSIECY